MIFYLAPGEPSYLPDGLLNSLHDEAFSDLMPLLQRCADRCVPWDMAAYLAAADDWCSYREVAHDLGCSGQEALAQIEILLQAGLVQERLLVSGPYYRFTTNRRLRAFFKAILPAGSGGKAQADPVTSPADMGR